MPATFLLCAFLNYFTIYIYELFSMRRKLLGCQIVISPAYKFSLKAVMMVWHCNFATRHLFICYIYILSILQGLKGVYVSISSSLFSPITTVRLIGLSEWLFQSHLMRFHRWVFSAEFNNCTTRVLFFPTTVSTVVHWRVKCQSPRWRYWHLFLVCQTCTR